jgi:hypothetical protein
VRTIGTTYVCAIVSSLDTSMTHNHSTHLWLARFTGRLVEHFPQMNPLSAVKRAIAMFPELSHLDAADAADVFAADPDGARLLVTRSQSGTLGSPDVPDVHAPVHASFFRQVPSSDARDAWWCSPTAPAKPT